ncbi:ST65G protein, partial [Amia calva]|nr:ST65G protein [Amia calva]
MMRYWGEIPVPAGPPSRSSFDLLQREFRSVEVQDPPLHQPSAQRPRPTTMLDVPSEPCSLTIHTVQLDPESDFYKGKGEPVTELSWPSCRQLLYQSVATVLAHAGFETAQESVLETLTDVAHEHYLRLSRLLRVAVDREARLGATPFPDVVEQVFHEVGIGSVLALQRFWQHRIKDYHSYMQQVSRELSEEYERLVNPEKAAEDSKPLKIKEEPLSDIAFPVSEEPEADLASGDQALPIGVLGAPSERLPSGLEAENSPHTAGTAGTAGTSSPLWQLAQVKMEPQDGEDGQVSGHGVLGGDVFEEPMSTMSEAGLPHSPSAAGSDASYGSHSPDSIMGASPVFNQRPKKRHKKM